MPSRSAQGVVVKSRDGAIRVACGELRFDAWQQFHGDVGVQTDRITMATEGESDRETVCVELVDGIKGLVHIRRPAFVVGRRIDGN